MRYEVRVGHTTLWKRNDRITGFFFFAFSDFTATTILGKFQNDAAGRAVERVLEKLSKKRAAEILAVSSVDENARLSLVYLFDRAVSAVSLPTHSSPPISRPSDHVRLCTLSRLLSCNCIPTTPQVRFPTFQKIHRRVTTPLS